MRRLSVDRQTIVLQQARKRNTAHRITGLTEKAATSKKLQVHFDKGGVIRGIVARKILSYVLLYLKRRYSIGPAILVTKPSRKNSEAKIDIPIPKEILGLWFWASGSGVGVDVNSTKPSFAEELRWSQSEMSGYIPIVDAGIVGAEEKLRRGSASPSLSPAIIYLASASRTDSIDEAVEILAKRYPDVPIRLVFGEYWSGHRRTQPLRPGMIAVYWYQTHDVLAAEAIALQGANTNASSLVLEDGIDNSGAQALIVSDHAENRRMWLDLLPSHGWQPVATPGDDVLPEGHFGVVIVDNLAASQPEQIERLRRVYPEARLVVGQGFPAWARVQPLLAAGAELLFGKPFQLAGLVRSFSSAALARR